MCVACDEHRSIVLFWKQESCLLLVSSNGEAAVTVMKPPWRNWLARSAVNRKVGGSSPPGGAPSFDIFSLWREYK